MNMPDTNFTCRQPRELNFILVFEDKKKNIFGNLDSGRKAQALQNRAKLNPIVKTVIFFGRKGIPIRGHSDTGTLALTDGDRAANDGNFRALLRFRIDSDDGALKEHLESCMRNVMWCNLFAFHKSNLGYNPVDMDIVTYKLSNIIYTV